MSAWKKFTGVQFFEDYLLPSNGQTKNKLWEVTGLPLAARSSPWFSLSEAIRLHGFVNGSRQRIVSALVKGGGHAIALAQCIAIGTVAFETGDEKMLAMAGGGAVLNAYFAAIQADIGMRCARVLEARRKKRGRKLNS